MSDGRLVLVAVAAFGGALMPVSIPLAVIAFAVAIALVSRQALVVALAVALACGGLASRAWSGIEADRPEIVTGTATVVTDPQRFGAATSAVLRIDGTRYVATGWGSVGALLGRADAGDRLEVSGRSSPYKARRDRLAALHSGTRLALRNAADSGPTPALWAVANALRDHLVDGSRSLTPERRALFTGIVYGDDRGQDDLVASDFRLAGLTHLLAVSGQNVAYVLTVARPALQRLRLRNRWIATVAVLGLFATITRFEPSVLRATAMAGLAVTARLVGREASAGRLLAGAVTLLLLVDPLLANTVAFRLSVAASAGIIWLQPLVEPTWVRWQWLRESLGVTLAAQLAVAPVLVTTFGPVSLVSIPANVAAAPVAGVTMAWGITAGMGAGFLPADGASVVHRATNSLLWLLETIARLASLLPLAPIGLGWLALVAACAALWALRGAHPLIGGATLAIAALAAALLVPHSPSGRHGVGRASEVWIQGGEVVLILNESVDGWLLDDLRRLQVRRIDLLVSTGDAANEATRLRGRFAVDAAAPVAGGAVRWAIDGVVLVIEMGDIGAHGRIEP